MIAGGVDQVFRLSDGRALGFDDVGPRDGWPIFYSHGVPSARAEWRMWGAEDLFRESRVRLVAVDRPGMGSSTFQPGRRLTDWPSDIEALSHGFGIDRFSVLGYSGGGPYAAVCAAMIPGCVASVALVSSLAPFVLPGMTDDLIPSNVRFLGLASKRPWLFRVAYRQLSLIAKLAPKRYLRRALASFQEPDRSVFARPAVHGPVLAAAGSPRGEAADVRLVIGDWGFNLADVEPPVQLWHGDRDRNASLAMFRYLARSIPSSRADLVPGEGHLSLIFNHASDILADLVRAAEQPDQQEAGRAGPAIAPADSLRATGE